MKANFVKFVNFVMSKEITNWKLKRLKTYGQRALFIKDNKTLSEILDSNGDVIGFHCNQTGYAMRSMARDYINSLIRES